MELSDHGINDFLGNYSDFVQSQERDYLDAVKESQAFKKDPKSSTGKLSYEEQKKRRAQGQKLKKDLEKTMLLVEETEKEIDAIEKQFADENFFQECDYEHINQMEARRSALKEKLDVLIHEWEVIEGELNNTVDLPE